jgi:hypothetical protein
MIFSLSKQMLHHKVANFIFFNLFDVQLLQPRRFGRPSTVYRDRTTMELLKTYLDHFLQLTGSDHSSQRMVELSERYGLFPNPQTSISHIGKQVRRAATNSVPNQFQSDSDPRFGSTCAWTIRQLLVSMSWHMGGRRDRVLPLYKFKKDPPQVLFCDTACHCEESGMNWLPHYYQNVKMFHDIFHGYQHLCSGTFDSRRSPKYNRIQTSLVEQCNSYLQSLRGVAKSGTMKLSTFMFWIEVFVVEWNYRKMN